MVGINRQSVTLDSSSSSFKWVVSFCSLRIFEWTTEREKCFMSLIERIMKSSSRFTVYCIIVNTKEFERRKRFWWSVGWSADSSRSAQCYSRQHKLFFLSFLSFIFFLTCKALSYFHCQISSNNL